MSVGPLLREWRERRRLSQLELSLRADVSTRHLSYLETGRSRPTAAMLERLAEQLDVPLRERNRLLLAAGHAPAYAERELDAPELAAVRRALRAVLVAHQPHPAVLLDRWWDLVDANDALAPWLDGVAPHLLSPPVNVLRLTLHPDGLAPRILNLGEWRAHLLAQLHHRAEHTRDSRLAALEEELLDYPGGDPSSRSAGVVLPLRLLVAGEVRAWFSVASHVADARDVTVSELTVEAFYRADDDTARAVRGGRAPG